MKPTAVVTHWVHPEVMEMLGRVCKTVPNNTRETLSPSKLLKLAKEAEALMIFMPDKVDEEFLAACPKLKIISSTLKSPKNVDVEACTKRGVWVTVVPDLRTIPAAELTVGLLIGLARSMHEGDKIIREGKFSGWRADLYGTGLAGHTLGIIGMGGVGQEVAKRLAGFDMRVIYCDPNPLSRDREYAYKLKRVSKEELLSESDFVILSVARLPETAHMINKNSLAAMKPDSYLINTSHGGVVDEQAVAEALEAGRLGGYAADVFEMEGAKETPDTPRVIPTSLLENLQKTFFTPHLGSAVDDTRREIALEAARNILQFYNAERPKGAINQPESGYGVLMGEQFF